MFTQPLARFTKPAEIDNPLDPSGRARGGKGRGELAVMLGELLTRLHRMHQEIRDLASPQLLSQGAFVVQICLYHLNRWIVVPRAIAQFSGRPNQATDPVASASEAWNQPCADISGGASHGNSRPRRDHNLHAVF